MIAGLTPLRNACSRAVLVAAIVALTPLSAAAGETKASASKGSLTKQDLQMSMARVARELASTNTADRPVVRRSQQTNPATQSPSFFKTPAGVLVAAVMVAGTAYAIYSAQHDRIHSAGKK